MTYTHDDKDVYNTKKKSLNLIYSIMLWNIQQIKIRTNNSIHDLLAQVDHDKDVLKVYSHLELLAGWIKLFTNVSVTLVCIPPTCHIQSLEAFTAP